MVWFKRVPLLIHTAPRHAPGGGGRRLVEGGLTDAPITFPYRTPPPGRCGTPSFAAPLLFFMFLVDLNSAACRRQAAQHHHYHSWIRTPALIMTLCEGVDRRDSCMPAGHGARYWSASGGYC